LSELKDFELALDHGHFFFHSPLNQPRSSDAGVVLCKPAEALPVESDAAGTVHGDSFCCQMFPDLSLNFSSFNVYIGVIFPVLNCLV